MARNATESDFRTSKMATGGHFLKNIYKKSCASDLNNVLTDCWPTTTWYKFTFGQYIYTYRQLCWERGNIHCVRPLEQIHTILVFMLKSSPMTSKNRSQSSIFELNQDTPEIHTWHKLGPNAINICWVIMFTSEMLTNRDGQTDGHANLIVGLVTRNPPKNIWIEQYSAVFCMEY